jgi:phage shock protein A
MSDITPMTGSFKPKGFWQRPEGITGALFLGGILLAGGWFVATNIDKIIALTQNMLYLSAMLVGLGALIYMILDPRMRNLVWYMYKSVMRWVTGIFVQIDPIGILKTYIDTLENNLSKMSTQIANLKGQIRSLSNTMAENQRDIQKNLSIASKAKELGQDSDMVLASRKAARLQESNIKYDELLKKMTMLEKILSKMHQNSGLLLEDTKDQVRVKEIERKAIRTSHSAMKNAMTVISGDKDQRAMFDMAVEAIADDVNQKIGEMERFMDMSANFMRSVDLQNGVWEDEGLKMLEQFEKQSSLMLSTPENKSLDLKTPPERSALNKPADDQSQEGYDSMFK